MKVLIEEVKTSKWYNKLFWPKCCGQPMQKTVSYWISYSCKKHKNSGNREKTAGDIIFTCSCCKYEKALIATYNSPRSAL